MKDALSYQVKQLLKENKLTIDFEELTFQIKTHPTYPSLHAVTGVLDHFNIQNLALDVPINIEVLKQLPHTFLAQVEINNAKTFAVVTKKNKQWQLDINSKEKLLLSTTDFLKCFTGIILAVDKDESNISATTSKLNSTLVKILLLIFFTTFGTLFIMSKPSLDIILLLLSSLVGLYISATILKQEQGESTVLGKAFCSNPTENKSCDAVLMSKGATIINGLKLSDLSIIYFSGITLAIFLLATSSQSIFALKTISFIAIPITIYSIYYQFAVVKKWCFLCLSIVAVMWFQTAISIPSIQPTIELNSIITLILAFTLISVLWLMWSKTKNDNTSLIKTKLEYFRLKRNFNLFNSLYNASKTINTYIDAKYEIVFGNLNSEFKITIITNPLCGHCKPVHTLIENLLNQYGDTIKITVRFNVSSDNPENKAVQITTRLLEIYGTDGANICLEAMHDIYGDFSSENWFIKWNHCSKPVQYISILQKEYDWCIENAINFTPEILINGKPYPSPFDRNDFIHFIEDLQEVAKNNVMLPQPENF